MRCGHVTTDHGRCVCELLDHGRAATETLHGRVALSEAKEGAHEPEQQILALTCALGLGVRVEYLDTTTFPWPLN